MECISIRKKGLFTTVQDEGRLPYAADGVSRSGVMDVFAARYANILVGNSKGDAVLEMTLVGTDFDMLTKSAIAITGADLSPQLNGEPMDLWKVYLVQEGDRITFGRRNAGARAYVAIDGGFDVPLVMGSASTFTRGAYGGFKGRTLEKGDVLCKKRSAHPIDKLKGRRLRPQEIPVYDTERPIRFIRGPHFDQFEQASLEEFLTKSYTITNDSDRMGYRLTGPSLQHRQGPDIISDYVACGTIQVPGSEQPIIHMADCGTSGGYTKIGVIITVDLSEVAQRIPGEQIQFDMIDVDEANRIYRERDQQMTKVALNNRMI